MVGIAINIQEILMKFVFSETNEEVSPMPCRYTLEEIRKWEV
jgi:hypothetical protein